MTNQKFQIKMSQNFQKFTKKIQKKNHLLTNIEIKKTHEDIQGNDEYMTNFTCFDENHASKIDDEWQNFRYKCLRIFRSLQNKKKK